MIVWNNTIVFVHTLVIIIISSLIIANPAAECRQVRYERNISAVNGTAGHVRTARSNADKADRVAEGFSAAIDTMKT